MNEKLKQKIELFLADKRCSEGGYAPVVDGDMKDLLHIVKALVEEKWERDPDGDLPVAIDLTDKTKYETVYYSPVPHHSRVWELRDQGQHRRADALSSTIMERCLSNAQSAMERLNTEVRVMQHDKLEQERQHATFGKNERVICVRDVPGYLTAAKIYTTNCHSFWSEDQELVRVMKDDKDESWNAWPVSHFKSTRLMQ